MKEAIDSSTIAKFNEGSAEAFEEIYGHFYERLVFFAYKLTGSHEEAEDIAIDTFVKLYYLKDRFETLLNIQAFLYITVRNNCLNYLDMKKRQLKQFSELKSIKETEAITEMNTGMEMDDKLKKEILFAETITTIYRAVEELPAQCRRIFKMYYYEGKKPLTIAEELSLSVNTVRVQKSRALQHLKMVLTDKQLLLACTLGVHICTTAMA